MDTDTPLPHDEDAWDDMSEFFARPETVLPKGKGRSGPVKATDEGAASIRKFHNDMYVEQALTGKSGAEINKSLGRTHHGPPESKYYKDRLARRQGELTQKHAITAERVIAEMAKVAFLDPRAFFDDEGKPIPINMLGDDAAAAIAGMEVHKLGKDQGWAEVVKYKLADKLKALDQLGRTLNIYAKDNERTIDVNHKEVSPNERARRIAFMLQEAVRAKENPSEGE